MKARSWEFNVFGVPLALVGRSSAEWRDEESPPILSWPGWDYRRLSEASKRAVSWDFIMRFTSVGHALPGWCLLYHDDQQLVT
jgi:hypothetical protein